MRKKTLRMISSILTLVFLVSLFQAEYNPAQAAKTATIDVSIGGKTYHVTPGQKVVVNTPAGRSVYDTRFVDGKPVAFTLDQSFEFMFGDGGSSSNSGSVNQSASTNTNTNSNSANTNSGASSQSSSTSTSQSAAQSSSTPANNSGKMSWNEFQKANSGKGMSSSEMSQAYQQYKQTGNTNTGSSASANTGASSNNTSANTNTNTPAEISASVAEGANTSSSNAAQSSSNTQTASVEGASSTSAKSSSWDPAKHPRDPQTGKFISHEEAVARGLMDPADANLPSSGSNTDATQTAQASTDSSAAGQSASGETAAAPSDNGTANVSEGGTQVAQSGTDAATAASGDKSSKPSIGDKFKSGYETGKNMTNQGFQNVKDSLKSGFSAKNLLVTAGITVGVDLASQIMHGEDPSLSKAVKQVMCAEFVGSVSGSVLGSAAGSFFVPFLSAIPVVGGALSALAPSFGSVVGSAVGAYTAGDLKNGRFSLKEAFKRLDWVGVTGQAIGSTAGAALGSFLGPIGTVVGGMVGGYFGNWAAHKIAGLFGKGSADLPQVAMPTSNSTGTGSSAGVITLGGDDVISVEIVDDIEVADKNEKEEEKTTGMTGSDVEQAIDEAYEEYTELFTEYSKLIQSGDQEKALEVAVKMNEAKARYDELRKKG